MRVFFPTKKTPHTGKGLFLNRLADQFMQMKDVSLVSIDKADIALHFTTIRTPGKINIIRYNGIYYNKIQDWESLNASISKGSRGVNGCIYQSQWSKEMCDKYLNIPKRPSTVILNGDDPNRIKVSKIDKLGYDHNFLAFSRWRPHKRLADIIESFLIADIPNSCLHIAGALDQSGVSREQMKKYRGSGSICVHPHLEQEQLMNLIKISTITHICWLDCCPNSVVESICAGRVVICNNVGGTRELVGPSNGIVCNVDKPFDNNPCFLYKPPKIDRNIIAKAMIDASSRHIEVNSKHLDIKSIANQYKSFFDRILRDVN